MAMRNNVFSFLMGGAFFSVVIFSMGNGSLSNTEIKEHPNDCSHENRYYELKQKLSEMELDFAKFYKKPKKRIGRKLCTELEGLKILTEEIQQEVYKLQSHKRPLIGKK